MSDQKHHHLFQISGLLLAVVLVAALAGTVASVFTQESLRQYVESLTRRESITRLSQVSPRALPGTYEEALSRVNEKASASVALVSKKTTDTTDAHRWLSEEQPAASGVVVTSDGWILVAESSLSNWKQAATEAEVWIAGKRYAIDQHVVDPLTGFALLKVTGANLPAIAFGDATQLVPGQILFALPHPSMVIPTNVVRTDAAGTLAVPAEVYATHWLVKDDVGMVVLVNPAGEMVAFGSDAFTAAPMQQISPFIQSVLREKSVVYAGLGVTVADSAGVLNLPLEAKMGKTDGALVVAPLAGNTFAKESPAQKAGIQVSDLIISLNGTPVTHEMPLALLLKSYAPGDTVKLSVIRANNSLDMEVTLGDYANLIY